MKTYIAPQLVAYGSLEEVVLNVNAGVSADQAHPTFHSQARGNSQS